MANGTDCVTRMASISLGIGTDVIPLNPTLLATDSFTNNIASFPGGEVFNFRSWTAYSHLSFFTTNCIERVNSCISAYASLVMRLNASYKCMDLIKK